MKRLIKYIFYFSIVLCSLLNVHREAYAQSNTPTNLKNEHRDLGRNNKGKRKDKGLQKSYRKNKSNQTKYPGNIWIDPKPKDYTAIKERVEKKPSRKKLKTQKARDSYFKSSSNNHHKSFVSGVELKRKTKQNYKYSSKAILSNKGNSKVKSKKKKYKKSSREAQKHGGNIFLQPEATKKDFNEIKARVEKNPGKSMGKRVNRQKDRSISNAALTQTYQGDINIKAKKGKKQTYKYDSKVIQNSSGNLKARSVRSAESQRKFTSVSSANFQGGIVLPARNHKRLRYKYMSKSNQKNEGDIKRSALKSPGPQQAPNWGGNVKSNDKGGLKQWKKYESKKITKYSGEIKGHSKPPGPQYATSWRGDVKSNAKSGKQQWEKYESKRIAQYSGDLNARKNKPFSGENPQMTQNTGNIKTRSKKKLDQQHQKKSSKYTGHEGYIAVLSKKKQDKFMIRDSKITGNFSGHIVGLSKKSKAQAMEGKSLNMSEYSGEVKQLKFTKWANNKKSNSNNMANFEGNIKLTGADLKERQFEHMSKTAHNFTGNVRINNQYLREKHFKNISDRNQQIIGDFRTKTRLAKDIDQQIISARVHNYQGGPKTSLFGRLWLTLFDNSGKLEKMDDKTRKPKYDSREYKIWY